MAELLAARGLVHRFRDGTRGLDSVSVAVGEQDFLVIAGRNGSGKTLLMRHFIGLATPASGGVFYRGEPIGRILDTLRAEVGLVFQDADCQILGQTVAEDVAFGPSNLCLPPDRIARRVAESLRDLHLEGRESRSPESLSGGEKRRLAIAGVMAMRPGCIILDEPFANLDLVSIRQVLQSLTELHARGKTIVVLTHELEKVLAHATRLAIMDGGRIVYDAGPEPGIPGIFETHGLMDPFRSGRRLGDLTWIR